MPDILCIMFIGVPTFLRFCPLADADGYAKAISGGDPITLDGDITLCGRADLSNEVGNGVAWGRRSMRGMLGHAGALRPAANDVAFGWGDSPV